MSYIDTRVVYHRLAIDSIVAPISQRKHKIHEEMRETDDEEGLNLTNVSFISEATKY